MQDRFARGYDAFGFVGYQDVARSGLVEAFRDIRVGCIADHKQEQTINEELRRLVQAQNRASRGLFSHGVKTRITIGLQIRTPEVRVLAGNIAQTLRNESANFPSECVPDCSLHIRGIGHSRAN